VTLSRLQAMSNLRKNRWHEGDSRPWSTLEWAGAMCGEAGEAANVAKKLLRIDLGLRGNEASERVVTDRAALVGRLANEIADTIIYASLLAAAEGIDLEQAIRDKFNAKSDEMGFPEHL
jgi:NTP pyrophosphatase (non-canonical NTP hydrolase)